MENPRKLNPRELLPPKEVIIRKKQRAFEGRMKNPIYRFFVIFFGEGF